MHFAIRIATATLFVSSMLCMAAPAPPDLASPLVGTWTGNCWIGNNSTDINFIFKSGGEGTIKVHNNIIPIRYRVHKEGELQIDCSGLVHRFGHFLPKASLWTGR